MPADQRVSVRDAAIRARNRRTMNRGGRSQVEEPTAWSRFGGAKSLVLSIVVIGVIAGIATAASSGSATGSGVVKVSKNSGEGLNATNTTTVDLDPTQSPTQLPTKSPQPASTGWAPAPTTSSPTAGTANPTSTEPTASPTLSPTGETSAPTGAPSTGTPTEAPSTSPTTSPTTPAPTGATGTPSVSPTTASPTGAPTGAPTASPTSSPTASPTMTPTTSPTSSPTGSPTSSPSETSQPSSSPSMAPTGSPTTAPTGSPTCEALIRLSNIEPDAATGLPPSGFVSLPVSTGYGIAGVRKLLRFSTGFEDVRVTRVWLWLVGTSEEQDIVVRIVAADEVNVTNGTALENVEPRVNLGNETPAFTSEDATTNFNYEFIPIKTRSGEVLDQLKANTTYYLSVRGGANAGAEWNVKCLNNEFNPCEPDTAMPQGEFIFEGALRNTLNNPGVFTPDPVLNGFAIEAACDN